MKPNILVQIPKNQIDRFFTSETLDRIEALGEVTWNPRNEPMPAEELKEQIRDKQIVLTTWGSTPIARDVLDAAERLQVVAHLAGSIRGILPDAEAAYDRGIRVLNSNYAIAVSVSESVLALVLALGHKIVPIDHAMRAGKPWKESWMETWELRGKTVGLIGVGMVAREVVKVMRPFEVQFLGYDPFLPEEKAAELNLRLLPLHEVLSQSDIVSLHAPQIPETHHLIGRRELAMLRAGAMLINTARGSLIDEDALVEELRRGRIYAALDVFAEEPLAVESELRSLDNVIVRPHLAGVNPDSRLRIGEYMVGDLERFVRGEPVRFEVHRRQLAIMT